MSEPFIDPVPPSLDPGERELAEEQRRIENRVTWVRRYSIFVSVLLTCAIVALASLGLRQGVETYIKIRLTGAIFGMIALIVVFNVYTIYQEILVKRLNVQLTEKQGQFYNLRKLTMIDPLTGLYNRRFAEQRLAAEVARSERKGHPLTILMLDLDNFGKVNDTYGRAAGDRLLQDVAARLNRVIRESDSAVRLGGDEFLILLPECGLNQLQGVLKRLQPFETEWQGEKIPVTFSAAWNQYDLGERPEDLLARTDRALSSAKQATRRLPAIEKQAV
jgi:diguanylate cyclase (GGDEF)-like protein